MNNASANMPSSRLGLRLPTGGQGLKLVIRGVNWLGDAVMTTPALMRLRERLPEARVTLATPAKLADLWKHHPAVDDVIPFNEGEGPWTVARKLRAGGFSLALILPNSPRSALECWLARIPQRVGYARAWRNWFLTHRVPAPAHFIKMRKRPESEIRRLVNQAERTTEHPIPISAHHSGHYLHLAGVLGANPQTLAPMIHVTAEEAAAAGVRFGLTPSGTQAPLWLGLNAGAEYGPAKRWPKERFIEAAAAMHRRIKCGWILLGGKADMELAEYIEAQLRNQGLAKWDGGNGAAVNLVGATRLRELCGVMKLCRVVLTNDTGPMHVAAAVGTPVVVPFGSTSPEMTGPGLPGDSRHRLLRGDAPCAPCFQRVCPIDFRCMQSISVDRVVEAVTQLAHTKA